MSRPPSAAGPRPKTSSGRAPSARTRPPSGHPGAAPAAAGPQANMNGSIPVGAPRPPSRAVSRLSTSSGMAPPPPSAALIPPRSSMGSRAGTPSGQPSPTATMMMQSRMGSAMGDRPQTGVARPPTALAPAHRPVTQQGVTGMRAVSRLGTGSTRQIFDKSYFVGLLRAKISQLNSEIAKLTEVYAKGESDRLELGAYEKRAKECALKLREMQGKLIDYNVIIDHMHTNSDMTDIEMEAKRVKEKADEMEASVQELFNERQAKDEEIQKTFAEIEEQKRLNQAIMAGMEPGLREHYVECKETVEQLKREVQEMERELHELDDKKSQLEMELDSSQLKKKAVQMHETLAQLELRESDLRREKESKETPEQKKAKLIEQMRNDNANIETIEKQIEQVKEHINLCNEELHDFETESDAKQMRNHSKYLELTVKEHQIDEFLSNYARDFQLLKQDMEEYSDGVVRILKKISANMNKVSLADNVVDFDPTGIQMNEKASPQELKDVHIRLQEEIINLAELETQLHSEIEILERRTFELQEQNEAYSDVDQISRNAEKDMKELEDRREKLEHTVPSDEQRREQLERRLRDVEKELEANPEYAVQKSLIKKLEMLRENNEMMREATNKRRSETDYHQIKEDALRCQREYNQYLISNTGRR